jgi:2-succinyl-5-enolpyruvyl-6-hydroxy-3-cyclohexene-1-carboxylate synthase
MKPTPALDARNVNALWCGVLAETLHRCGVKQAVICPGSRSAPLAFALAQHAGIEAISILDERSAAFFALGLAKRSGRPAVLVCTSGTAAANFLPAVVEAHESGVALLVITADRPPELRGCASGQTIDQQKLYGDFVGFYHELAVPEATEPMLRYLRQTMVQAYERALSPQAAPVHLNAPFRDPLPPVADDGAAKRCADAIDWNLFFEHVTSRSFRLITSTEGPVLNPEHRGLIIAGPAQPVAVESYVELVEALATRLGWPVLADGLSPLRNQAARVPSLVSTYDLILRNAAIADRLRPEFVLCLDNWPTSKVLRAWLEKSAAKTILISRRTDNRDALHGRAQHFAMPLGPLTAMLPETPKENGYARQWRGYETQAAAALGKRMGSGNELFEGRAAWLLAKHLPPKTSVFIANSMPVRDVEYFWGPNDGGHAVYCNRGANGIDGTLSTALGVAQGGKPAVLLTGDLALLHDTNGFLLRPKFRGSLTIVLINNRGGGIFEHLPVAQFNPPFEEFFATPQDVDFGKLCATYGVEHVAVRDWPHFTSLVSKLPAAGLRVLELTTDRKRDAATRKQWFGELAAQLS